MRVLLIAAALVFLLAHPSPAQTGRDPLLGLWEFQTEPYAEGCQMRGVMSVAPGPVSGRFACSIATQETCPEIEVKAKQECTIARTGDDVSVKSVVREVSPDVGYSPDDFELKIKTPGQRMEGWLRSYNSAPVVFVRPSSVPVS